MPSYSDMTWAELLQPGAILTPGRIAAIQAHTDSLTATATAAQALRTQHETGLTRPTLEIAVEDKQHLRIFFPEQHSTVLYVGKTERDLATAMHALLRVLKDRTPGYQHAVATPGAPTEQELVRLARESRVAVTKAGNPLFEKRSAPRTLTLEDLDLD